MIKFFRKIRRKLLTENRFTKYLIYAIGEIVLVVIGILIALSVNNWNEKTKNKAIESDYYCRLLEDLELEKELMELSIQACDERIELAKSILIDLHSQSKSKYQLLNAYLKVQRMNVYVPRRDTYKFLIASGDIKLITNKTINSSLTVYYGMVENIAGQINQNRDEIIKSSFGYKLKTEFGYQEFEYFKMALGTEIIELLPNIDWTKDKSNPYFKQFQDNLVFIIGLNDRQKQHIARIKEEMKMPYELLVNQCLESIKD